MNINIFVGLLISIAAIYFGAPDVRNDIMVYLQFDAFLLVILGTIGSTLIGSSFSAYKGLFSLFVKVFFGGRQFISPKLAIEAMVHVAKESQHASRQALPKLVKDKQDKFLTRSIDLLAAGLEKEFVVQTLNRDIDELRNRHGENITIVRTMGSFAPMFGMAGTVIGVIQVLKNVTDIDNIVSGMALALLTTLYGLFLSSILFIPLANKLKSLSEQECLSKQIILCGTEMILDKEIPLKVEKFLTAYLKSNEKESQDSTS